MIHDQFTDKGLRVLAAKIRSFGPEMREMLKTAEIDYDDQEALPASSFAWPEERRFAIHTPEHAALSSVYAHGEDLPAHVRAHIEKAAELHEVPHSQIEKVAETHVDADDFSSYLIPQRRFGKIENSGHVKEAEELFSNNYKKLDLITRANAAATLVKHARLHQVKIKPALYKHAGLTQTNTRVMGEWLEVRSNLSKEASHKQAFTKLAAFVQDKNSFARASRGDLIKLAETISALDEKADLVKRYDRDLPDAMLTVFNTTKTAEETIKLASKDVPISKLCSFDPKDYGDALGEDIVEEISDKSGNIKEAELMDILKTLPADLQTVLVRSLGL
jgi:hypothetical protein